MSERILVTGGAGFIGSHVVDALMARGQIPIVIDDFSSGSAANLPLGVETIVANVADPRIVDTIVRLKPDGMIHAAAQASVPRSMAEPQRDREINLLGTEHVIAAASRVKECRVVFVSTGGGIYGDTDGPATEQSVPRPKSYYSAHKYAAERYLEYSGLSYAIARLANVYGPRQRSDLEGGVVSIFAERLTQGQEVTIYGSGEQLRDFVHVSDVVRALLIMLDTRLDGLWNVGTGRQVSVNELLESMATVLDRPLHVRHVPSRPGDVFRSCLNVSRIENDLGWIPHVPLEVGVASLLQPKIKEIYTFAVPNAPWTATVPVRGQHAE